MSDHDQNSALYRAHDNENRPEADEGTVRATRVTMLTQMQVRIFLDHNA